jgi:hypothetical protein
MKKSLESMIESCFTYGGADRDAYNFKRYIEPYKKSVKDFETIYEQKLTELKTNYKVLVNVHTDFEGCTYNSLVKI